MQTFAKMLIVIGVFFGAHGVALAVSPRAMLPMDVFELEWASDPMIAPDASRIIYTRNFFDIQSDRRRSNLWEIDLKTGLQQPITSGTRNDGGVQFSNDGERIAYLSQVDGSAQLHVRWLRSDRVVQITRGSNTPSAYRFSPDGRQIAFLQRVPLEAATLAKMPTPPKGATWAEAVKVIDRPLFRFDGAGFFDPGHNQIFVVPADGGTARQLTSANGDFANPVWTADGRALIATANLRAGNQMQPIESDLYRVEIDDGALKQLTARVGPDTEPAVSPDGRQVAYIGFDDREQFYQVSALYLLDLASGKSRRVTTALDRDIQQPLFAADNKTLVVAFDDHGQGKLARVALASGELTTLTDTLGGTAMGRPYGGGSFSVANNGAIAYTYSSDLRPADVAIVNAPGKARTLTGLNEDALGHVAIGAAEPMVVKSQVDGRAIQAWVVRPPGFDPSKKYPLLLEIHGGPVTNYGPHFAPEIQLYAAQGYVVVYANPRGSNSYGEDFGNAIHHDYPNNDYLDLMSVVDGVIAKGAIDERNLFITGGSGGGVLTAWAVGHTERFRAAVVAKPVINWYSFVLTSDIYPLVSRYWFPGPPWEHAEEYLKRSPISYVGKITTPTMVITGEQDLRTPIAESEQLYQALKLKGVDTMMVRIPGATHSINARPSNMIAQVLNTTAWFERHRQE